MMAKTTEKVTKIVIHKTGPLDQRMQVDLTTERWAKMCQRNKFGQNLCTILSSKIKRQALFSPMSLVIYI